MKKKLLILSTLGISLLSVSSCTSYSREALEMVTQRAIFFAPQETGSVAYYGDVIEVTDDFKNWKFNSLIKIKDCYLISTVGYMWNNFVTNQKDYKDFSDYVEKVEDGTIKGLKKYTYIGYNSTEEIPCYGLKTENYLFNFSNYFTQGYYGIQATLTYPKVFESSINNFKLYYKYSHKIYEKNN